MARSAGVIEVNGNRYDAVTGQLVGAARRVAAQVKSPTGGVIDGLVRKPALSIVSSVKPTKSPAAQSSPRKTYKTPTTGHRGQRSQTLMRSLVSRPAAKKSDDAVSASKAHTAAINHVRAGRAKSIDKNTQVNHFGRPAAKKIAAMARLTAPSMRADRAVVTMPHTASAKAAAPALPSMMTSVSHQRLEKLLDEALIQADAHKMVLRSRVKGWQRVLMAPKWLTLGASSLAVLLLAGFFAWQNIPQVSMRVAATRAHVSAAVPAYTPMGYGVAGPIQADDSQVTIKYTAADSAANNYAITQQSSNWDSSSVAANAVPGGTQVQSSQVNGTTVYIYGQDNNATWVNHGVLFNLQDKANLSSDQILKIAGSL